ncbi:hypothetical protein A3H03_01555 [Candidatus Kuenenbacteria bacterium RIFCSPLOWO2_12_FULL_42_13]|uniref:Glycosyl transferase family 1 domain-containing protein n=2 Tax=Candidatus Kueneniibacteriota TaxID=1752740 RepID=A0A1F6G0Q0_9BACT|nr:MAG: hypothetical protein A3H55_02855 [Candidatus Kuenenbacteria bacterium RIFCSPLOWO2_02_FULL_42_16]OGG91698.1 MAG: hypothetical protein A3H03_01555 [Candidatus Kuenenbacteria bacterium RIFCSPLOWO2_12_FULL_42_13]
MKILMLSNDRALLGEAASTGDTIARHRAYGQFVEKLAIIVLTKKGRFKTNQLSETVYAYPTNAHGVFCCLKNGLAIAKKLLAAENYDLVVCQDPFLTGLVGWRLKNKYGLKLLLHFHGDFWDNPYWLKENIFHLPMLWLSKCTVKRADAIRVVSGGIKTKILRAKITKAKIEVIPTPVNLEQFKTPDNQTVISIKNEFPGQQIILFVGRLSPEKNLPFLIHCFKKIKSDHRNVALIIAGDGPEEPKIRRLISALKLEQSTKLLGRVAYQNLPSYFHAADIFVLPSRHESFGKVILEAAAAGKPTVASATTGAKEIIIDGKTGFLTPINNGKKFVEKTLLLLTDDVLRIQAGANAYAQVTQKYEWQTNLLQVVSFWQKIINNKN